jgi:hypothetical protein
LQFRTELLASAQGARIIILSLKSLSAGLELLISEDARMDFLKILEYAKRRRKAKYNHVENDGSYAIERDGDTVYLLFEKSNGKVDWKNNLDFPARPYNDMGTSWMCHRGFLKVWKSIRPYLVDTVADESVKKFIIVGYSHGAAIAALAHEYVWFNRPDLRENGLEGYGFGAPKVYWGFIMPKELRKRWVNFHPIKNEHDIVTWAPPFIFGFTHVNQIVHLHSGEKNPMKAHYWSEYIKGCEKEIENDKK